MSFNGRKITDISLSMQPSAVPAIFMYALILIGSGIVSVTGILSELLQNVAIPLEPDFEVK